MYNNIYLLLGTRQKRPDFSGWLYWRGPQCEEIGRNSVRDSESLRIYSRFRDKPYSKGRHEIKMAAVVGGL